MQDVDTGCAHKKCQKTDLEVMDSSETRPCNIPTALRIHLNPPNCMLHIGKYCDVYKVDLNKLIKRETLIIEDMGPLRRGHPPPSLGCHAHGLEITVCLLCWLNEKLQSQL